MALHELRIERRFFAAHALRLPDGSFEPLHAHDWRVAAYVCANQLNDTDLVMDFHVLEKALERILDDLRDCNLNDHPSMKDANPSAERVAELIYRKLAAGLPPHATLTRITVTESPGCQASYEPDGPRSASRSAGLSCGSWRPKN